MHTIFCNDDNDSDCCNFDYPVGKGNGSMLVNTCHHAHPHTRTRTQPSPTHSIMTSHFYERRQSDGIVGRLGASGFYREIAIKM